MGRPRLVLPAVVVALLAVGACSSGSRTTGGLNALADEAITVASFNFPESELLAEIYSQSLEAGGYRVERSYDLGPRELVVPALVSGLVELVPEYAGAAVHFLSVGRESPGSDSGATLAALQRALDGKPVTALEPAAAQDANTFVVTRETAKRTGVVTLSDVARVAGDFAFGGPPECSSRPLCLIGLDRVYGIAFREVVSLDAGGPLTLQALESRGIDVALLFSTDPAISGSDLVELTDDRGLQPSENVTPLVHTDVIRRFGDNVVARIDAASARLTTPTLRDLNAQVAAGDSDIATVVSRWLDEQGLR